MSSKPRILVTRRWPAAVEQVLAERFDVTLNEGDVPLTAAELAEALRTYDAVLPTVSDRLPADLFAGGGLRAKILGNYGVGYNHIDVAAAKAAGIVVANTPGVLTDCTADIAMTLLLAVARRAGEGERQVRAGEWSGWRPTHMIGGKVTGKTLGIIGFGRIGKAMAKRCHFGFDMDIVFYNRSRIDPAEASRYGARQLDTVEDVLKVADFVSLHCPGGGENRHLINAERLALMKKGAYLVNTARGDVIDEPALIAALENGVIRGAGLDVFEAEPNVPERLRGLENVVLLPHLGSATEETRVAMGMKVVDNITAFFDGREPPDRVA
ncbi:D-glycerate dehydrogenase [Ensifer sp. ENS07]|jgi:lactate dehydrogenase-like 2-hydroxyacid dehydrogenase|uniref:D-glycerate dehydrogenase n=1 Tax=Ensifer adhaerens TaxID=106592 RepID=A0A9Q8Y5E9_ENSAD|nr:MULTISPECIES: D-glycerate dehydrogenase [Ensifer]MBD9593634.1 D-glycerate dehydrogenase [Ensifer sp. ENS05]MBD9641144.1 D-glycerate dehydrogenase [Ensifer sp. ENS07]USJ22321.1 D-glycerate dehydrogenase [Ensifer adhaerens]UTV35636.1 D-glycerate dehydrogenase [Ensifer adhaerens]SDM84997.1 Lactate dehydrogenase [Ensifer sp. YR511]